MTDTTPIVWTPEMDDELRRLRATGLGINRCAERIGVANSVVSKRIAHLGLPKFTKGRTVAS